MSGSSDSGLPPSLMAAPGGQRPHLPVHQPRAQCTVPGRRSAVCAGLPGRLCALPAGSEGPTRSSWATRGPQEGPAEEGPGLHPCRGPGVGVRPESTCEAHGTGPLKINFPSPGRGGGPLMAGWWLFRARGQNMRVGSAGTVSHVANTGPASSKSP